MKYKHNYVFLKGKSFPIIPLLVGRDGKQIPIMALIDSGAITSLFDADIARALGIEIENGEPYKPKGIGGSITAYIHKVALKIDNEEIMIRVAFTDELLVPINLLGREGLFEAFSVLFNDMDKSVTLEKF